MCSIFPNRAGEHAIKNVLYVLFRRALAGSTSMESSQREEKRLDLTTLLSKR